MVYQFSSTFIQGVLAKYEPKTRKLTLDSFIVPQASLHSQKENDVLTRYFHGGYANIGFHEKDGKWVWYDGLPVDYLNWKNAL